MATGTGTIAASAAAQSDYTYNAVDIVKDAVRAIGALSTGESLPANEQADGLRALNLIVKQLMGPPSYIMRGFKPWQRERTSLTLSAKARFDLKPSGGDLDISAPIKILSARLKDSDANETPLTPMTSGEYDDIRNKADTNMPTAFYYERRLDEGHLYLDCIPEDTTNYTVEITCLDQLASFETVRSTTDFPQEYYRVLKFCLAVDLGPEYGADISAVKILRDEALAVASAFDRDETFYYFQPGLDY